jgi:hypothetical protein
MCKDVATHCFTAVHYLHEISKILNEENKIRQINYISSGAQLPEEHTQKFPFRVAKEIEFINDRLKFMQKEMAAKFKVQNVAFSLSDQMREQVN